MTYPILARDVLDAPNRNVGDLEGLEVGLGLVVPDLDLTIAGRVSGASQRRCRARGRDALETADDVGLGWVEVHRLDPVGPGKELPLHGVSEWLRADAAEPSVSTWMSRSIGCEG